MKNRTQNLITKLACSVAVLLSSVSYASDKTANITMEMTAQDIINKAELASYYAGNDGKTQSRMIIVDSQGRRQVRQFTILRKDVEDAGDQKMLVFFSRPADVSGMVFRVEKHTDENIDDDRWLYLPGLDLVKRISAGDKRTSFVGSHFFYEDISGRSTQADTYSLVKETANRFILNAVPKKADEVEFSRFLVEVDKETFMPMSIKFFDKSNKAYRLVETLNTEEIDGHTTVTKSKISDLKDGGHTLMEFRNISYDIGLPDSIFTERSLRTPPLNWLRK
jgi:hypothetical protein